MIFTTIEGDAGTRITTTMQARKVAQQQATEQLNTDIQCLKEYEQVCKAGEVTSEDFARTMGGASENAQKYAKNIKDGTGSSKIYAETQGKVQGSLKKTSVASKIATASVKAFNIVLSTLASFAVSFVISKLIGWIYDIANASEKAKEKAQELGEEFKNTKKEIEDYKTEIKELYTTLNDSSSSIEEVANARKTLMSVQDELIEKFGDEEGAINNITKAINGQIDALDKLTQSEWKEKLNKFNSENRLAYNTWDYMYNNNTEKMLDVMSDNPESTISFSYLGNEDTKAFLEKLQKAGYIDSVEFGENIISLDGEDLKEVYDNLLELQTFAKDNDATDNILNKINKVATNMKDTIDKYGEMYDQYVLYEEILPDEEASGYFDSINEAYKDYQDAVKSGNNDAITKAMDNYADVMGNALDNSSGRVKQYFEDMYPDLQKIVGQWQFEVDFNAKDGTLDDDINKFLSDFDTEGDGVVADELLHLDKSSDAYKTLKEYADSYNLSIEQLIEKLEALGLIKSTAYAEFEKLFGEKEGFKDLTDEELKLAYSIENVGDMTFDEVKSEIEWLKKQASKETVVDVRLNMISDLNDMSEGFEELDKIYASIKDKDPFDFKLLDEKDFKENFSDLPSYSDFIETVTGNPDNINACQEAFNKLLTDWIYSEGILKNVTEENAALTESMLKQMGVANAHDIVMQSLSGEYGKLSYTAEELAKAEKHVEENTIDTTKSSKNAIATFISEAEAAGIAKDALYQVIVQENVFKNNKLSATDKIREISKIASAYGVLADSIMSSVNAEMNRELYLDMQNGGKYQEQIKNAYVNYAYDQYSAEIAKKLNSIQTDYTGGSTSNKETENSKETFDWIETKIQRIQRLITNLGKTVSATWKTWTERNDALKKQMSEINNEIALQQQGYLYYLSKANSVGLSSEYQELVKNGSIRIDEISDESLKKQIQQFKEFYEKALACKDAVSDLNDELVQLAMQEFDDVSKKFEGQMSVVESEIGVIESYVAQAEEKGYAVSKKYYDYMYNLEKKNNDSLRSEYKSLNDSFKNLVDSGKIKVGSEAWYNMSKKIREVEKSIVDSDTALIKYQQDMKNLDWEGFDKEQEAIGRFTDESDFLIDMMSDEKMYDENGSMTEHGKATLGLHAVNYDTYTSQVKDYADEIAKIEKEIAEDPYNQKLLERKQSLIEAQRQSATEAKNEKQAMKDLIEEGYNSFLDSMSEMIEKRKEAMQSIKDLYDYEKNISKLNDEVTVLKKQEIAFSGDDSEEGRAQLQQIQTSLKEAEENLQEAEYEKYLSDQQQMLDNLYDEAEGFVSNRLDNIDGLIGDVIESINGDSGSIKKTLEDEAGKVGVKLSESMIGLWGTEGTAMKVVGGGITTLNQTLNLIKEDVSKMLKANDGEADKNINDTKESDPTSYTPDTSSSQPSNPPADPPKKESEKESNDTKWGSWFIKKDFTGNDKLNYNTSIVDRLKWKDFDWSASARAKYYKAMGGSGNYTGSKKQNVWMLQQMKANGFAKGGTIGNLISKTGEDGFVLARTGEEILSLEKISAMKDVFESMNPIVKMLQTMPVYTPYNGMSGNVITNDIEMNITLEGINNADEFIHALKTDKKFEKFVQQITIGNAMGRNTLSKNRY